MKDIYRHRLEALRREITAHNADGFLVPLTDEYQSEYSAPYAARLAWLTGFTGSAGMAAVLAGKAVVLTDARYSIQIKNQVDSGLYETADLAEMPLGKWLAENASPTASIGYDPRLFTSAQLAKIGEEFKGALVPFGRNPVDEIWKARPEHPDSKVEIFPDEIAGKDVSEKRTLVGERLKKAGVDGFVLTLSDSIAWTLNVRAQDFAHTPVALSYAFIDGQGGMVWFIGPQRLSKDVRTHIGKAVEVVKPADMEERLERLVQTGPIGLDFETAPLWLKTILERAGGTLIDMKDPCIPLRTVKSTAEQESIRAVHKEDALALIRFLHWLEEKADTASGRLSELDLADMLMEFRHRSPRFRSESFPAIIGFGANGAIVHYRATEESHTNIKAPGLLLIDSGGQYEWGTTDITRTVTLGTPEEEMRVNYTRVLKGHIALASARFAPETPGVELDRIARAPLQEAGLDYAHGTGHGVGCYLSVHERGAAISPRAKEPLKPGMLLSNEPGYYKEGAYGIRIENLVFVQAQAGTSLLGFETVSLVPFDRRLIVKELLSKSERQWINNYHAKIRDEISSLLESEVRDWFSVQTANL